MTRTGAWLAVYALEQLGIEYTFGIPGVHNIELYDELGKSRQITPVLVTHEGSAAFMADAISRTTSKVGTLAIVPAAGMAHAMSGIGEAFLAGVPMLILSGGIRRDTGRHYQLHQLDQQRVLEGITKGAYLVTKHRQVVPTIFKAYQTAVSGEPGPVFVELPGEIQMFSEEVGPLPKYESTWTPPRPSPDLSRKAVELLRQAKHPGLYLGWGARRATKSATELAEMLEAPVSTTAQGLSVFPANHPLHTGMGFGPSAVPAARNAFEGCDCLLAVGVRFAELATGSYGLLVPPNLIHIDINPKVFGKNYPARLAIEADAAEALGALVSELKASGWKGSKDAGSLRATIKAEKEAFKRVWTEAHNDKAVSPGRFFAELRERLKDGAFLTVDDGNHTFLAMEQFPVHQSGRFISPTDFNCMGYAVPAAIAAKLGHREEQVVAIVGDGAFLMTGLEILTASTLNLGVVFCVFSDGELAQISQVQKMPLNRKTCSVLGRIRIEGIAEATGAAYLAMSDDSRIGVVLEQALEVARGGRPVIVDVNIDYSRKTEFTKGVLKVNLAHFPLKEKARFIGRALKRHILG